VWPAKTGKGTSPWEALQLFLSWRNTTKLLDKENEKRGKYLLERERLVDKNEKEKKRKKKKICHC